MKLARILTDSARPLFIIGSRKNSGKTVVMNRLRDEAMREGEIGFGLCSAGWDGEAADHLTGAGKPAVTAYMGDLVMTAGALIATAEARFELLWAASVRGRMGRMLIGRCLREGRVELAGPASISALGDVVRRFESFGARRVLIDGAIDRRSPVGSVFAAEVGFAFRPKPRESPSAFAERAWNTVWLYRLPEASVESPGVLKGADIAFLSGDGWRIYDTESPGDPAIEGDGGTTWLGGPLTPPVLESLLRLKIARIVVDNPARLFVSETKLMRLLKRGLALELWKRPKPVFVAYRSDGGDSGSLPPGRTREEFKRRFGDLPCFDPWDSHMEDGE